VDSGVSVQAGRVSTAQLRRVEAVEHRDSGGTHAFSCRGDDLHRRLAWHTARPGGHVRDGVRRRVQAVCRCDHQGDRLRLDLSDAAVQAGIRVVRTVEHDVAKFVREGLHPGRVIHVHPDGDLAGQVVGEAVRAADGRRGGHHLRGEAASLDLRCEPLPQPFGCLALQQGRPGPLRDRLAVGLGDVLSRVFEIPSCSTRGSDGAS
jgi:hypothetical protein